MTTPPPGARGPRRPLDDQAASRHLSAARKATTEVLKAQATMEAAAIRRQQAIAAAVKDGLSIRQVAVALEVSPAVVQQALRRAT